jgi:hypothetical protein
VSAGTLLFSRLAGAGMASVMGRDRVAVRGFGSAASSPGRGRTEVMALGIRANSLLRGGCRPAPPRPAGLPLRDRRNEKAPARRSGAPAAEAMAVLMRGHLPFVEVFGDEQVVTRNVPRNLEILLLLSRASPNGLDREALGRSSKFPSSTGHANYSKAGGRSLSAQDAKWHTSHHDPGEYFLTGSLVEPNYPPTRSRPARK